MADAFRGLTLRLGADARPLQSAISSITRSASEAQRQLNVMNKALKFDTTNASLMASRIDLMGDKAVHSARAMLQIRTAMKQTVASMGDSKAQAAFLDLVKKTKNAYAETQKLRSEYNRVDAELQKIYDSMAKVAIRSKNIEKSDDILAKVAMRLKNISETDAAAYVKQLKEQMKGTGEAAEKAAAEFKTLVDSAKIEDAVEHVKELKHQASGVGPAAEKAKLEFDKLASDATKLKEVSSSFKVVKGDGQSLVGIITNLTERHKFLNAEYEKFSKVQSFRNARMQMTAYLSEVRQAASETARMATELHGLGTGARLIKNIQEMKQLDAATETAVADAKKLVDAYRAFPKNLHAAQAKMRATAAAEETLKVKAEAIKASLKKIEGDPAFDKLAASSNRAYVNAAKVEQKYSRIASALEIAEARAGELRSRLNSMDEAGADKLSKEYKDVANALEKAEKKAQTLRTMLNSMDDEHAAAALTMQWRKFEAELAEVRTQAAALRTQLSLLRTAANIGKSFREFGFGMYASLTPAVMMAGRYAIQAAEDTDKAYRDMRKTVNGTEEDFQHLLDAALEFSTTHVTTAETMLEIEALGGQLGIQVENLEEFAHTVSNLDIATNMNAEEIAADLGKMATVMDMTVEDYDNFGDALVRLGNNMPAFEGDIMKITTRFMGMGKIVGMAPDEMLAWATAATATGQKAEAAGSSMLRFISNMESAMNNEDDLQKWAEVAGMTGEEFKNLFQEDASQAMYKFVEGLGKMQNAGESVNQELKDLKINNVRDKQLLEGLANQMAHATEESNVLGQSLQMANDAWNGDPTLIHGKWELAGDAMREAERKSEGFSGELQKMRNQATLLANVMAEGAAPIIKDLGQTFGELASYVKGLPDDVKTMVVGFAGFLASLGPLTVGLGTFLMSLEKISVFGKGLQGSLVNAGSSVTRFGGAIANLRGPTSKAAKAFATVGKAISSLGTTGGTLALAGVAVAIGLIADAIGDAIRKSENYKKATEGLKEAVADTIPWLEASSSNVETVGNKLTLHAKSSDQLAEAQVKMASKIQETNETASNQIARLNGAKKVLDEYLGKTGLNAREQGKFKAAVDAVNEICGTQYQVLDAVNGALADENGNLLSNVGAIDDYIEKKKQQIKIDALSSGLSEMYTQESGLLTKLLETKQKVEEYRRKERNGETFTDDESTDYAIQLEELKKVEEEYGSLEKQIGTYESQLGAMMNAQNDATKSLDTLIQNNSVFATAFAGNDAQYEKMRAQLADFGITTEEFGRITNEEWTDILARWSSGGEEIGEILQEYGISAKTAAEVFGAEMQASGDTFDAVVKKLGGDADKAAEELSKAGISAYQLADIGSESFNKLYETSDHDLALVANKIEALNRAGIDPKQLHVEDGQLVSAKGRLIDFNEFEIGEKKYRVTADGIEEIIEKTEQLDEDAEEGAEVEVTASDEGLDDVEQDIQDVQDKAEEGATVNVDVSDEKLKDLLSEMLSESSMTINATIHFSGTGAEEVTGQWNSLKESVEGGAEGKLSINHDSVTNAESAINDLEKAAKECCSDTYNVNVTVTGGALSELRSIRDELNGLDGKTATTYVKTVKTTENGRTATGAIFNSRGKIPLNAAGAINGIVNHAMLTNIGWVGEAGAEAVMHMRNAGGAVIPLSNRRYVRPFARAVASEMGTSTQVVNKYYSVNGMTLAPGSDAAQALEALYDAIRLEEAV